MTLEIGPDALSSKAVRGLLEDWLIPFIVEEIAQGQMRKPPCGPVCPR